LHQALIHRSYAVENGLNCFYNYERLEFLGDAVVNLIVSKFLFSEYEKSREGVLSKQKSFFVSAHFLSSIALSLGLNRFVLVGSNERSKGYHENLRLMSDVLESLVGALYLDGAMSIAENIVLTHIKDYLNGNYVNIDCMDYKSFLQKYCTKKFNCLPFYKLIKEYGPDHDKTYFVEVILPENHIAKGTGKSKQLAEKMAAKHLLEKINFDEI
jgi:ribonuclease-3